MTADTMDEPTNPSAVDRLVSALADPGHLYTASQVVWLIQRDRDCRDDDPDDPGFRDLVWKAGYAAGYQARTDEENRTYRDRVQDADEDSGLRSLIETVDARRAADRAAGVPRAGDYRGGPVRWESDSGQDRPALKEAC